MTIKSIIWTISTAVFVFFTVVYLGMKYNWVNDAKPKLLTSDNIKQTNAIGLLSQSKTTDLILDKTKQSPALIDEPEKMGHPSMTLGSLTLSIEDIVSECQALTQSVGIPSAQVEEAMMECINRNSSHLTPTSAALDEKMKIVRRRCDANITQRELLSEDEVKILLDECVASS